MQFELEINLVDELTNFPGLQTKQMEDTISFSQSKYAKSIMKKVGLASASHERTSAATHVELTKDDNKADAGQGHLS